PNDLEVLGPRRRSVDRLRRDEQLGGHERHLVAAVGKLRRLAVGMLRDPAELRVVVVADDADAHARRGNYPTRRSASGRTALGRTSFRLRGARSAPARAALDA